MKIPRRALIEFQRHVLAVFFGDQIQAPRIGQLRQHRLVVGPSLLIDREQLGDRQGIT